MKAKCWIWIWLFRWHAAGERGLYYGYLSERRSLWTAGRWRCGRCAMWLRHDVIRWQHLHWRYVAATRTVLSDRGSDVIGHVLSRRRLCKRRRFKMQRASDRISVVIVFYLRVLNNALDQRCTTAGAPCVMWHHIFIFLSKAIRSWTVSGSIYRLSGRTVCYVCLFVCLFCRNEKRLSDRLLIVVGLFFYVG